MKTVTTSYTLFTILFGISSLYATNENHQPLTMIVPPFTTDSEAVVPTDDARLIDEGYKGFIVANLIDPRIADGGVLEVRTFASNQKVELKLNHIDAGLLVHGFQIFEGTPKFLREIINGQNPTVISDLKEKCKSFHAVLTSLLSNYSETSKEQENNKQNDAQ